VEDEADLRKLPILTNAIKLNNSFPMTEVQKAYLLGRSTTFEIGGVSNHIYYEFKYETKIDISKLEHIINLLIRNYPELRTVFDTNTLTQKYLMSSNVGTYKVKCDEYTNNYDKGKLQEFTDKMSHFVYQPNEYPLFSFHISRFKDCDILHFSIDLILLDVESRQKFLSDITRLYSSNELKLKNPELNFKDYQDYVSLLKYSKWYKRDKAYWVKKIENLPLRPILPLKLDSISISKPRFGKSEIIISKEVWNKFKSKANNHGVSVSSALLSIYGYVLSRYANTSSFLITLTVFNRYSIHPHVNDIWGDFTTTNLFGYKRTPGSILDNLLLTHQSLWEDLDHGMYSGIEVQRCLQNLQGLDPNQAVSPIVFTGIVGGDKTTESSDNNRRYFLNSSEDISSRIWIGQTSQAWIDLQAVESKNQFHSTWLYVEQLFDQGFIEDLNN
ncbi:condensation domain-containing protein, partial [Croceitalea sp. MTPC5]|uniref:condensation domain-containing protein n=1 Tax=Croceitalea sp. MTPC5 TaxID=3056565 RepID=UPI0030CEF66C